MRKQANMEPADVRRRPLTELFLRMKDSGYSVTFRYEVITAEVVAYKWQVERAGDGTCPLYRPKGYMAGLQAKKECREEQCFLYHSGGRVDCRK
jgi:hypothetical protein